MHALTHSLAHRAPPATRTRVRWQPYNSIPSSTTSISARSPATYLNTPASSVTSSPPSATPVCEIDRLKQPLPSTIPQTPRDTQFRDANKHKYAIGLVDQAVKSLCEIWHPQDIPFVFLTSSRAIVTAASSNEHLPSMQHKAPQKCHNRNTQLPSPVSPSTQPSPPSPSSISSPASIAAHVPRKVEQNVASSLSSRSNLVPIKGFVHEVLRRSRTSGNVLQTALCYLEAIRSKVPELVRQEQLGEGVKGEPESDSRIVREADADINFESEAESGMTLDSIINKENCANDICEDIIDTVRMSDGASCEGTVSGCSIQEGTALSQGFTKKHKSPSPTLPPLAPLPSPLLCPRRAFLASLILASKFTQDKCYSNRAWAKLSGLPPREIGRCERALGDALDWRLWVGKVPSAPVPNLAPTPAPVTRPVVRSRSDGALMASASSSTSKFFARSERCSLSTDILSTSMPMLLTSDTTSGNRGLRRSATLPAEAFDMEASRSPCSSPPIQMYNHTSASHDLSLANLAYQEQYMPSPGMCGQNNTLCLDSGKAVYQTQIPASLYTCIPNQNLSPRTPTLTFSPSSTESSSGDRTVQMTFLDDAAAPFDGSGGCATAWPWPETCESIDPVFKVSPPLSGVRPYILTQVNPNPLIGPTSPIGICGHGDYTQKPFSSMGSRPGTCPWGAKNHHRLMTVDNNVCLGVKGDLVSALPSQEPPNPFPVGFS